MRVHVQPDRAQRRAFAVQEIAEIIEAHRPRQIFEGVATQATAVGGLVVVTPEDIATRAMTPKERIQRQRHDAQLAAKATAREEKCWRHTVGCKGKAITHVAAVEFDMKADGEPTGSAFISTNDYPGPVPGFCLACQSRGPQDLAQAVFVSRPEMQWGFKPRRWFVLFTDGTQQGGLVEEIDIIGTPTYIETYTRAEEAS